MSVSPFCQIYSTSFIDTFQSSVSRFHYFRQRVLWCSSSIPLKYGFVNQTERENSVSVQAIKNASLSGIEILSSTASYGSGFSNGFWLDKWNKAQHPKLRKRTEAIVDYRNGGVSSEDDEETSNYSTMDRIVRKLKKFGYVDDRRDKDGEATETLIEKGSVEDIFYVEEGILPNSNGGFSEETPFGDKHGAEFVEKTRFPWEKPVEKETGGNSIIEKRSKTSLAELTLPESELRRLRHLAIRTKQKTKIGGAGVTQAVVDAIHEKWATSEVVRLKCEGAPALNMKRMHEILERKTGGLVIWRSGTSVSLYRGMSYESPSMQLLKRKNLDTHDSDIMSRAINDRDARHSIQHRTDGSPDTMRNEKESSESLPEINYEDEVDTLLEGLGPRFEDWPGPKPIPVDADLLPGVIPGYKPPFRILPYGVRAILGNREVTALRRLARVIPPHFALGRRREHQGLACAMVKLWEKSSIAKIAFKRGVQTTTSERMAEDIKKLTGSIILSRNKDYIVFYRGKDFLSAAVTEALLERERLAKALQDEEEQARLRACSSVVSNVEEADAPGSAGTLGETLEANSRWGRKMNEEDKSKVLKEAEVSRHAHLVRKLERKLFLAERKLGRAERALAKVEEFLKPSEYSTDRESLTDEERFMFRKLGLRMKAFLLLGRRGIFDGTIENMHLHWKYRELVKIIVKARNFDEVRHVALSLEAESGGVLVSVDKISKGFAVVVFRGRDYERPPTLRPKNLLTKRKALARSIELQRSEALRNHVSTLYKRAEKLRFELEQIESVKDEGDEILYSELDSSYPTDEETTEDELDEMYPEDCDSGKDEVCSENDVTNFSYIQNLGHESKDHLQELHRFGGRKKETEEENLME